MLTESSGRIPEFRIMSPKQIEEVIRSSFNDTGYYGVRSIEGELFIPD